MPHDRGPSWAGKWVRSTACNSGACIEVQHQPDGGVLIRNSTDPAVVLEATAAEWAAFLASVHAGDFTPPAKEVARCAP